LFFLDCFVVFDVSFNVVSYSQKTNLFLPALVAVAVYLLCLLKDRTADKSPTPGGVTLRLRTDFYGIPPTD
jgi:hypothetical protein